MFDIDRIRQSIEEAAADGIKRLERARDEVLRVVREAVESAKDLPDSTAALIRQGKAVWIREVNVVEHGDGSLVGTVGIDLHLDPVHGRSSYGWSVSGNLSRDDAHGALPQVPPGQYRLVAVLLPIAERGETAGG